VWINEHGQIRGVGFKGPVANYRDWVRTHDPCAYCGELPFTSRFTLDHIIPQSQGGKTSHNMAVACSKCNHKKGSKGALEFLLEVYHRRQDGIIQGCYCRVCRGRLAAQHNRGFNRVKEIRWV
jgi:5-methylcytosine-specific restriction endonuclease McrA